MFPNLSLELEPLLALGDDDVFAAVDPVPEEPLAHLLWEAEAAVAAVKPIAEALELTIVRLKAILARRVEHGAMIVEDAGQHRWVLFAKPLNDVLELERVPLAPDQP